MLIKSHRPLIVAALALAAWAWSFALFGGRGQLHQQDFVSIAALSGNEAIAYVGIAVVQLFFVAGLALWVAPRWGSSVDRFVRALLARPRVTMLSAALFAAALSFALSLAVVHQHTLTEDEKTYLFQSKLLLLGKLSIAVPPGGEALREPFLVVGREGHWSGQYFWAQSALLALGLVVHAVYVVPALEVACAVFFTGLLADELSGDLRVGVLAAGLASLSPIVLMTGATLHNASLSVACVAVTLWSVARLHRGPDRAATWALGLSTGVAMHNRPFDQAAILLAVASVLVVVHARSPMPLVQRLAPAVAIALPFLALHLLVNAAVSGEWRHSGYWLYYQGHDWKPFGLVTGVGGFDNSGMAAFAKTITNVARMMFYTAGGPLAFVPVVALVVAGRASGLLRAGGWIAFVYYGAYFFYASASIQTTGPVYFAALVPVLATCIALASVAVHDLITRWEPLRRIVPALLAAQAVGALAIFWPPALLEIARASKDSSACDDLANRLGPEERALVFVAPGVSPESWTFWHPMPSPMLDDRVLFPQAHGVAADSAVAAQLGGGRSVYLGRCVGEPNPRIEHYDPATGEVRPISR